jgi:hypothetical protein
MIEAGTFGHQSGIQEIRDGIRVVVRSGGAS